MAPGLNARAALAGLVAAAAIGLAACGGGGGGSSEPTKTVTNGAITIGAFDVHFDVGEIRTAPGPLKVTLVNHGSLQHTFKIDGNPLTLTVNSGESQTGTWTLAKGTHKFECTFPGHAGQGMKGKVVVG